MDPAAASAGTRLKVLQRLWADQWPAALEAWSRFTRLSEPRWCLTKNEARAQGLDLSFAMIRLTDQAVIIDLEAVEAYGVSGFAREVLAHEIGHHVYCPADLADHARMLAHLRRALPTKEHLAGLIGNLYTDLLINDRLQRSAGLNLAGMYQALEASSPPGSPAPDKLWVLYMRISEILWSLQRGTLSPADLPQDDTLEGDALLGARLVRAYAREWLAGAGRFATLILPYLLENDGKPTHMILRGRLDMQNPAAGSDVPPAGLTEMDAGELEGRIHPLHDPKLGGTPQANQKNEPSKGQCREPFEYGEILRALGMKLDDHDIAVRYYRERALPYLVRFPSREVPESTDPLPEGVEPWDIGSPLEDVDWMESVMSSPTVIPNLTTLQRIWGTTEGAQPKREPIDLDLYVDSSGSIPNPQQIQSFLSLAGAIVCLSALRAGARVQATLWSGANQFETTAGFIRDEHRILQVLTGYIGGGTAFPIHLLRDTFSRRSPADRPVHILIISDDGVTTMFDKDERGQSGWDISRMALEKARGGGTMVLNLFRELNDIPDLLRASQAGWNIFPVRSWEQLVEFARKFSQLRYT